MRVRTFRMVIVTMAVLTTAAAILIGVLIWARPQKCVQVPSCGALPMQQLMRERKNAVDERDRQVLDDQLYPPLNRSDAVTQAYTTAAIRNGQLYQNPNDSADSFRLIGYLSSTDMERDAGGNNWKLFGRMKDRNNGEFYIVPANNNIDLKIALTNEIITGERLRDVYTVPKELRFNSPMLNQGSYRVVEIPKSDLSSARYL